MGGLRTTRSKAGFSFSMKDQAVLGFVRVLILHTNEERR